MEEKSKFLCCSWTRLTGGQGDCGSSVLPGFARRAVHTSSNNFWQHQLSLREGALPAHLGLPFSFLVLRAEDERPKIGPPGRGKHTSLGHLSGILRKEYLNFFWIKCSKQTSFIIWVFWSREGRGPWIVFSWAVGSFHIWEGMQSSSPYCLIIIANIYWELLVCQGTVRNILMMLTINLFFLTTPVKWMLMLSPFYRLRNMPRVICKWWHQDSHPDSPVRGLPLTTALAVLPTEKKE